MVMFRVVEVREGLPPAVSSVVYVCPYGGTELPDTGYKRLNLSIFPSHSFLSGYLFIYPSLPRMRNKCNQIVSSGWRGSCG